MDSRTLPAAPTPPRGLENPGAPGASPDPAVGPTEAGKDLAQTVKRLRQEIEDLRLQERSALAESLMLREQLRRLKQARLVRLEIFVERLLKRVWRRLGRGGLFQGHLRQDRQAIEASGLFDGAYYRRAYPDVAEAGADPLAHYLRFGAKEGRDPSAAFSTFYYLDTYPDVRASRMNPLLHYILVGKAEGRSPQAPASHSSRDPAAGSPAPGALGADRPPFAIPLSTRSLPRIAVVLHLYYLDLWPEIGRQLQAIQEPFDLIVSVPEARRPEAEAMIAPLFPLAQIVAVQNRGRDVGPFLMLLGSGRLDRYDYVCKIHGKKSPHRLDGNEWRHDLLGNLLGGSGTVGHLVAWLDANPGTGLIGPAGLRVHDRDNRWGSNEERVRKLAARAGLAENEVRLDFFAGSMFWCRPAALEPLKSLKLGLADFEPEQNQIDGTLAHALERLFVLAAAHAGFAVREADEIAAAPLPVSPLHTVLTTESGHLVKTIAFYLPQFHPIPENDLWWGRGFTEWNSVARARPMFEGHHQPRLPADLGFYDLRLPEVREAQAKLASAYGIHGFCYHYYWFHPRRLLETPIQQMLKSGRPDFPFCICWANENWTRRWDGLDQEILVPQNYGPGFAQAFIDEIIPYLRDPRYIRYEGRPVLVIYRSKTIPDLAETIAIWRKACRQAGIGEIHLCVVRFWDIADTKVEGFDAVIEFPPHRTPPAAMNMPVAQLNPAFRGTIHDYAAVIEDSLSIDPAAPGFTAARGLIHRGLMMGWDNTPRRGVGGGIFHGATPETYGRWLTGLLEQERRRASPESLIFINAWNEWGEGTMLEPDTRNGRGYLEATRRALAGAGRLSWGGAPDQRD
ncbi:MAG TPA: glycoside hydrolase family 99-like domain-containing protein [Hypericibacter adhaerens]|uniref:glycoside hydrolase family 99-like domain-containing protein n=1 Tax=Hypericibacter adhaerens TaxID=2602016 RepID=UPI002B6BC468|nr:glycoside hydrolase family 99-like domain-containing protein [Hypericibacter adhaerens]HWA43838.1 glycoside hydrolase family 99-like domain-containing protein [Hypericibacter adhaerens]